MRARRRGFTLVEVAVVLAVMGIAAALAVPRMAGWAAVLRTRAGANAVAADLAYARGLAVRRGMRVRVELESGGGCPAPSPGAAGVRYRIVAAGTGAPLREGDLRVLGGRLCLASNRSEIVVFDSRGLPVGHNNRTLVLRDRGHPADTLTLSSVGRVLRRY
jgi:prepilin-type N-terminal cleavage/methylation domain-containing protein